MFNRYQIKPVVFSEGDCVTPFSTHADALEYADEYQEGVAYGLYGYGEDGCWQNIADMCSKESMLEMVDNLFGIKLDWQDQDEIEFSRDHFPAIQAVKGLLEVLHPGAVGLIGYHHGADRQVQAAKAIFAARGIVSTAA